MKQFWIAFAILVLLTLACGQSAPAQDPSAIFTSAAASAWAPITLTAAAGPTATTPPTQTPIPTSTPTETLSPTPPPAPILLTGSGDSIVDVAKWDGPALLRAKHTGGSNFIVTNYGANNEQIDLLVNTIGAYTGTVPLDFLDREFTTRLEVKASGPWEFTIDPIDNITIYPLPAIVQGTGDDVVGLKRGNADTIVADASQVSSNFIVQAYSTSGRDLIFNEIGPYTGTALLTPSTVVLVVQATGPWALQITTR